MLGAPSVEKMPGDPNPQLRLAGLNVITVLGPDAAPAVPALIELLKEEEKPHLNQINALAAIGPAARESVAELQKFTDNETPSSEKAAAHYALFCIRGNTADLNRMVDLLKDANGCSYNMMFS